MITGYRLAAWWRAMQVGHRLAGTILLVRARYWQMATILVVVGDLV